MKSKGKPLLTRNTTMAAVCGVAVAGLAIARLLAPGAESAYAYWPSALNTIALLMTLVVVVWYAEETAALRRGQDRNASVSLEAHVVIKRRRTVSHGPGGEHHGWDYVASNVGPGVSRRTVYFTEGEPFEAVAALRPGEVIRLRDVVVEGLRAQSRNTMLTQTHFLLSEGLDGRWFKSANVVNGAGDVANRSWPYEPTREERIAVDKLVESYPDRREQGIQQLAAHPTEGLN